MISSQTCFPALSPPSPLPGSPPSHSLFFNHSPARLSTHFSQIRQPLHDLMSSPALFLHWYLSFPELLCLVSCSFSLRIKTLCEESISYTKFWPSCEGHFISSGPLVLSLESVSTGNNKIHLSPLSEAKLFQKKRLRYKSSPKL